MKIAFRWMPGGAGRPLMLMTALALLPGVATSRAESPVEVEKVFRVMSYNIQHGRGLDDQVDLARIAEVVRREGADLVGLQEVDRGVRRTGGSDQPARLAELTGMAAFFLVNHPHQGGEYGNALLTRFPAREVRNTHLPQVGSTEQRGVIQAVIEIEGQDILFLNTHLAHRRDGREERLASVAEFRRILEENRQGKNLPVIFVGDFNALPGSDTYREMTALLEDVWLRAGEGEGATVPVRNARRRIDYVWISREAPFEPVKAWVPYTEASDHLPVVVEFRMIQPRN